MRYRLTCILVRFIPEKTHGTREFDAPNDQTAIRHAENPAVPLKIIDVVAGDAVATVPRELIELTEPPRVVKRWDTYPFSRTPEKTAVFSTAATSNLFSR